MTGTGHSPAGRGAFRAYALAVMALLCGAAAAADVPAVVRTLAYTTDVATLSVDIDVVREESTNVTASQLFRGTIPLGVDGRDAMGFVADLDRKLLFLDRNRNRNAMDDGPGMPAAQGEGRYIVFRDLSVGARSGQATVPYEFDLQCYGSTRYGYWRAVVNSGWQGVVEIAGRKWTLGVVDDMDGVIDSDDVFVLRSGETAPAASCATSCVTSCGRAVDYSDRLAASTNLSVNGRNFALRFAWRGEGAASTLDVSFAPSAADSGTLEIEGGRARRIVLAGPALVVLDPPAPSAGIPAGFYETVAIYVGEEGKPASHMAAAKPVRVFAGGTRRIKAGGPLQNVATVTEYGSFLKIGYELRGADGNSYNAISPDRDVKPVFSARRNGKELDSGTFEYG